MPHQTLTLYKDHASASKYISSVDNIWTLLQTIISVSSKVIGRFVFIRHPQVDAVKCVITVPATWTEDLMQFMRKVAHKVTTTFP